MQSLLECSKETSHLAEATGVERRYMTYVVGSTALPQCLHSCTGYSRLGGMSSAKACKIVITITSYKIKQVILERSETGLGCFLNPQRR